jgi:hypothetical protein
MNKLKEGVKNLYKEKAKNHQKANKISCKKSGEIKPKIDKIKEVKLVNNCRYLAMTYTT